MTINRKTVGDVEKYNGHSIEVKFLGPDLLCYVDGVEIPNFYINAESAKKAGRNYCDLKEKEK